MNAFEMLEILRKNKIDFNVLSHDKKVDWALGDRVAGVKEKGRSESLSEAIESLFIAAARHYEVKK